MGVSTGKPKKFCGCRWFEFHLPPAGSQERTPHRRWTICGGRPLLDLLGRTAIGIPGSASKQSGGEFASSGAPARAQDATLQISRIGATLSERSCRRPQYLQPPAPSCLPVDASDLPIRSGGAMAQRGQRGMRQSARPNILTRTPQLDSAGARYCRTHSYLGPHRQAGSRAGAAWLSFLSTPMMPMSAQT